MEQELDEEQVQRIVMRQLRKLEEEYEEVHKYDMTEKLKEHQSNTNIQELMRAELEQKEKQEEEQGKQEQENQGEEGDDYVPYQQIGGGDGNGLFEDDEQEGNKTQHNNEGTAAPPEQPPTQTQLAPQLSFQLASQLPPQPPTTTKVPLPQPQINEQKIKSIAQSFQLQCPDWVTDPQKCQARLRQLFSP